MINLRLLFLVGLLGFANVVQADIIVDGSLGGSIVNINGPDFAINENRGRRYGSNLFHSFSTFGINKGESATFHGSAGINNIIARVTGGNASIINGTISTNVVGGTNLWMINPAGWVFGSGSKLNVQGSFYVSTSDSINFQDGSQFLADPAGQSVLTVADPVGYSFFQPSRANITIASTSLNLSSGNDISLLGGDVLLKDSEISVPGGRILIGSSTSTGDWKIDSDGISTSNTSSYGDVNIDHAQSLNLFQKSLTISDRTGVAGGGLIQIVSNNTSIVNGAIDASVFGLQSGGDIKLQNTGDVSLTFSLIESSTSNDGATGDILIRANDLTMQDKSVIRVSSLFQRRGQVGGINLVLSGNLKMQNANTDIIATTNGSGQGGSITIKANQIKVFDFSSIRAATFRKGDAGNIIITANDIDLRSGGTIDSSATVLTAGVVGGEGGNILINTDSLTLANNDTVITTQSVGSGGSGGDIVINTNNIKLLSEAEIRAESNSGNPAGTIKINNTETILVDGAQITTESLGADGGQLNVNTNILFLRNGRITTSVEGVNGDGGNITIIVDTLIMDTGFIQANTASLGGEGGDILINASRIIPSQGLLTIGGDQRLVFSSDSGLNVIQAAAPNGVSGNVSVSPVVLDISGDLSAIDSQFLNENPLNKDPCRVARGQKTSSLVPLGKGALPFKANDALALPISSYLTEQKQMKTESSGRKLNHRLVEPELACNQG